MSSHLQNPAPQVEQQEPEAAVPVSTSAAIMEDTSDQPSDFSSNAISPPANVVPFRPLGDQRQPGLTAVESNAFNEIARQLTARLDVKTEHQESAQDNVATAQPDPDAETSAEDTRPVHPDADEPQTRLQIESQPSDFSPVRANSVQEKTLLERFPFGILVYRLDRLLFANPAFLERTGYASLQDLSEAGGLDALFVEPDVATSSSTSLGGTLLRVAATEADPSPADARLMSVNWDNEPALALVLLPSSPTVQKPPLAPQVQPVARRQDSTGSNDSELERVRREASRAAAARAELLARISHDIRAPLSTITGFADVMIEQRFGPLGNERYVEYLKDIRASGERVIAIVDDMLDVSQIESGQVALAFTANNLNQIVEQCVAAMQPQANRERIIIRSSLARTLPPVIADARTLRQIATTLIAGAIRMSKKGAQIIVSTALDDGGTVALRLRDAGRLMSEAEIKAAMDPLGAAPREDGDNPTALNLSVARALVAANRAKLNIRSSAVAGTLIEVVFATSEAQMPRAN